MNLLKPSEMYAKECEQKNSRLEGDELRKAKALQDRVMARLEATEHQERVERARKYTKHETNPRWDAVRINRALLTATDCETYPIRAELEQAWQSLEQQYGVVDRNDEPAEEPFAAIMYFLEFGFYPPPELMLWMLDAWDQYLYHDKTMEQAFLGPAKQKAGGYSTKHQKQIALMVQAFEFTTLVHEDTSGKRISEKKYNAAQKIVDKYGLNITPANLIRKLGSRPIAKAAKAVSKAQAQQLWKELGFKRKR